MCLQPKLVRISGALQIVKCGKCQECMKERQNDVAHRLILASHEHSQIHFFTFTYDNEHIPFYIKATDKFLEAHGYKINYEFTTRFEPIPNNDLSLALSLDVPDKPVKVKKSLELDATAYFLEDDEVLNEFSLNGEYESIFSKEFQDELRRWYFKTPSRVCYPEEITKVSFPSGDDYIGQFTVCPSIRNKDVSNFIKLFRGGQRHKCKWNFKYYFAGEYGPKTNRPHYHMITYGLTDSQAEEMRRKWVVLYGNPANDFGTTVSKVLSVSNGKSHISKAARYVGKYVSKGCFECSNVKHNKVIKPRGISSKHMWSITQKEWLYWSGSDLLQDAVTDYLSNDFKRLPSDLQCQYVRLGIHRFLPEHYYTDDILEQIKSRLFYTVPDNDYQYNLGKSILNKVFKYECERNVYKNGAYCAVKSYLSTPLSLAMSRFIRSRLIENMFAEYRTLRQEFPTLSRNEAISEFRNLQRLSISEREECVKTNYKKQLRKSFI